MPNAADRNERTVRRLFDEVVTGQQYDLLAEFCAADVVMHRPGDAQVTGRAAYADHYRGLHAALPDLEATLTDVVADEARVATRFLVTATHRGELLGIAPTGRTVRFSAQVLFRLHEGTVTEEFHQSDRMALRNQLRGE